MRKVTEVTKHRAYSVKLALEKDEWKPDVGKRLGKLS